MELKDIKPKAGEKWFVQLAKGSTLSTWVIGEITALTVVLCETEYEAKMFSETKDQCYGQRYRIDEIDFIERSR